MRRQDALPPDSPVSYTAPRMYGNFVPDSRHRLPVTVMSFEPGVESHQWPEPLPRHRDRLLIYRQAVAWAGLYAPSFILDRNMENVLVRKMEGGETELVQLDVTSRDDDLYEAQIPA